MNRKSVGVLLAGGLSRRMGGGDKALVALAGQPLLSHAAARLAPQVGPLIINANGDPTRFAAFGLPVVADETADFPGPLAGILASLLWTARTAPEASAVASVSADAPFIPPDLVTHLEQALAAHDEARVAVARSRGRRHHVIGLWRLDSAPDIAAALARGERKAETMVDRLGAISVPFPDLAIGGDIIDPFFNINTPDDLVRAEHALSHAGQTARPFVFGVAGWKNSGKTTLVERLVSSLRVRGYRVSTIKHTHHAVDTISPADGTDSARHLRAGAEQVLLIAPNGWSMTGAEITATWHDEKDLALEHALQRIEPVDIVLVEGLKSATIPKIEVRRVSQGTSEPLFGEVPGVLAIAADHPIGGMACPTLSLDDIEKITDLLLAAGNLPPRKEG